MTVKLVEPGAKAGERREILVTKEEFLIGRGVDCDLRLNESVISRHHCVLRQHGSGYQLSDLGSSNGTYLNGQRLVSQAAVKSGDELRVGTFHFIIDLGDGDGIIWGAQEAVNPGEVTSKMARVKKEVEAAREEMLRAPEQTPPAEDNKSE